MTSHIPSPAAQPQVSAAPGAASGSTLAGRNPESLVAAGVASSVAAAAVSAGAIRPERRLSFVGTLPVRLDVRIPLPNFRFKDLTSLKPGQVLPSEWAVSEDLPVAAGDVRLLWAEFAVADQQLTVRVTRVA